MAGKQGMNELESATIISPTPELTPLPEAYWEETPYFKIASRQISRGFAVAPVHPNEKHGVLWNQYSHPATTLSEVIQHAKDFPKLTPGRRQALLLGCRLSRCHRTS